LKNKSSDIALMEVFNCKASNLIQSSGLPYFKSNERIQRGASFGLRLRNAIEDVFNKGFEKVIIIGNDCIELKSHHLLEANIKLLNNDIVLGADFNGGAYLIGVSKSVFDADKFEAVSWKTLTVFNELQSLFSKQTIALLSCLNDCNSIFDFKKALNKLPLSDPFRNLILYLLQNIKVINYCETSDVSFGFSTLNHNKGSPYSF
jgi:uncharacterized protein